MNTLYTIFIFLAAIQSIQAALSPSQCMPLNGSRYCREFGQFIVPKNPSPWLRALYNQTMMERPPFETVEDLDRMFDTDLVNIASAFFQRQYGCSMKGYDRYETTILCGAYVQVSNGINISLEDYRCGTSFARVCSSTLTDWYDSLEKAIKDPSICVMNETDRKAALTKVAVGRDLDSKVDWLSGRPENNCIDGRVNENARCGYSTDAMAKKMKCSSKELSTGGLVKTSSGLGAGEIFGIVSAVIGAVLIAGFSVMAYRKRKQLKSTRVYDSSTSMKEKRNSDISSPTALMSSPSYDSHQKFHHIFPLHVDVPAPSLARTAPSHSSANSVSTGSTVFTAVGEFASPSNIDEIVIRKGDQVYVQEVFDDGWALGRVSLHNTDF
ncbi:hypothetical protein BKA69DRAFT_1045811, partial [Paraphysoderma sedebokerense]